MWGACSGGGVIAAALSFGLALMVLAASFGHISGVHFNPAVTIGVLIAGEMQIIMAVFYVFMQLLGGEIWLSFFRRLSIFPLLVSGLAAGGILRLLLPSRVYSACQGGATLLTRYGAYNETGANGAIVYHGVDYVSIWQVCHRTRENKKI